MEKIKNLSLKRSFVLYISISLVFSFSFAAILIGTADKIQQRIWVTYIDEEEYVKEASQQNPNVDISVPKPNFYTMTDSDRWISEICDFIQTYGILLLSIVGSCIGILVFYRNKLKVPLKILSDASKRIANENLEFHITYHNKDEMGQLCQQFEKMRSQLEVNNRRMWKLVEQERT